MNEKKEIVLLSTLATLEGTFNEGDQSDFGLSKSELDELVKRGVGKWATGTAKMKPRPRGDHTGAREDLDAIAKRREQAAATLHETKAARKAAIKADKRVGKRAGKKAAKK